MYLLTRDAQEFYQKYGLSFFQWLSVSQCNRIEFDTIKPVETNLIRLTITNKPTFIPLSMLEFTVFEQTKIAHPPYRH
jgi:hypothetical protein